jgi:acyl-coenzyme A synthetase/AMP-(fatty) acid ligase
MCVNELPMFSFTIYDLLEKNLANRADHPALILGDTQLSYGELAKQVNKTAAWLSQHNVRRGDRVGICFPRSFEEVIATFACARIGAIFININHQWKLFQFQHIIEDCGIRILFTERQKAREIEKGGLIDQFEQLIVQGKTFDHPKITPWDNLLEIPLSTLPSKPLDLEPAALLYTSGSTGKPKGVIHTHHSIVQFARSFAYSIHNDSDDRLLGLLSIGFIYGLTQLVTMFLVGGTVVLQPASFPADIVTTVVKHQVTGLAAVPPLWLQIIQHLEDNPTEMPALRYITNSGGKLGNHILQTMPKVFPGVKIYLMYGLTEGFRTFLPPELFEKKRGAIGKAIPNSEVFVVDPEKGLCGPNEPGELIQRGSFMSLGYWGKPEATAEKIKVCEHLKPVIGEEKVLFTGDIVKMDEDGILWFVSRADTLIKSSGFRIGPEEIEDMVYASDLVNEVVAFGVEDELLAQVIHIAVSSKDGETVDVNALKAYCRRNMPNYMIPRHIHCWSGEIPRTANGKLDRLNITKTCIENLKK